MALTVTSTGQPSRAGTVDPMDGSSPITVVLSDDHQVVRSGLRVLLGAYAELSVIGEAGDVRATLDAVRAGRPRVLVLDLNLGGESSLDLIPQLREQYPDTQIVVLTMQENPAFAQAALRAGATGYLLKDAADTELIDAIVAAARGERYLNPRLGARLAVLPADAGERPDLLSPREREVLSLIALGHTNPEIARRLAISVRTVESHRAHIQQKTGLTSRAELVAYAHDHGLVG